MTWCSNVKILNKIKKKKESRCSTCEFQDQIKVKQDQMNVELGETKNQALEIERKEDDIQVKVTGLTVSAANTILRVVHAT